MANLAERIRQTGRDAIKDVQEFREACDRFAAILEGGASTLVETAKEAATIISGPAQAVQAGKLPEVEPDQYGMPQATQTRRPDGGPRR